MICSKFITFAVTNTTKAEWMTNGRQLWFAQNSLPLRWQIQPDVLCNNKGVCCDLLKIHYLCGDKYNLYKLCGRCRSVVICSKFITFAVTNTTRRLRRCNTSVLWFAQNSLPLRWQIQHAGAAITTPLRCDLLKIHYLCGDKYNKTAWTKSSNVLWFAQNSLPLRWQIQLCRVF